MAKLSLQQKLAEARKIISGTKMKKAGKNTFSKYEYFTPDQVHRLVDDACQTVGLLTLFDLERDSLGVTGLLRIYDLDSDDIMEVQMATAIPEIKATNIAQQLGGAVTYTERYLKQSVFGIVDNSLDFDTTENTQKRQAPAKKAPAKKAPVKKALTDDIVGMMKKYVDDGQSEVVKQQLKTYAEPADKIKEVSDYIEAKSKGL